jgi:type I restriction enzyme R subunit
MTEGLGKEQLVEMQKIIDAEKSDLFDVLAHVAYAAPPVTRGVRASNARIYINTKFSARQQAFLDFVLDQYVTVGVDELDQDKLTPLLRLKYHNAISDATADLGSPEQIRSVFAGFQRYLYEPAPGTASIASLRLHPLCVFRPARSAPDWPKFSGQKSFH